MSVRLRLVVMGIMLLMAALLAAARGHAWHWLVCTALGFSWVGDALLMGYKPVAGNAKDTFLAGMAAFALAQAAYVTAFARSISGMAGLREPVPGSVMGADLVSALLPVYLLAGVLFWVLMVFRARRPWALKAVALPYALLLCAMAGLACAASFVGTRVAWPLVLGGVLFIVSDGIIAAHEFQGKIANGKRYEIIVWATYIPAQFLLMLGASWLH